VGNQVVLGDPPEPYRVGKLSRESDGPWLAARALIVIAAAPVLLDRRLLAGPTLGVAISPKPQLAMPFLLFFVQNETGVRPLLQLLSRPDHDRCSSAITWQNELCLV
jgi:hypothetical protein